MLAAVRAMAKSAGDPAVSLRIALALEKCPRCHRCCAMFIEPAGMCAACWAILVLNSALEQLKETRL